MKLQTILELPECRVLVEGRPEREISRIFCCDLLSIAMSRAPADGVWVTVMGNRNTLAVASLTDTACVVLAEGTVLDEGTLSKAGRRASPSSRQSSPSSTSRLRSTRRGTYDSPLLRPSYPFLSFPMRG